MKTVLIRVMTLLLMRNIYKLCITSAVRSIARNKIGQIQTRLMCVAKIDISSESNEKIKLLKSLDTAKGRGKTGLIRLEGHRQVIDALKAGFKPVNVLYTPRAVSSIGTSQLSPSLSTLSRASVNIAHEELAFTLSKYPPTLVNTVSESVMRSITDTVNNQGVVAAFERPLEVTSIPWPPTKSESRDDKDPLILVLDGVSDPGNAGSLVRSAAAFGAHAVISVGGCDLLSPKAIRSAMGLCLSMPLLDLAWPDLEAQLLAYKHAQLRSASEKPERNLALFLADGEPSGTEYTAADYCCPSVVVVGSEAAGLSDSARQCFERVGGKYVRIPMSSRVESLNAAIAGSIILSEVQRQRLRSKDY